LLNVFFVFVTVSVSYLTLSLSLHHSSSFFISVFFLHFSSTSLSCRANNTLFLKSLPCLLHFHFSFIFVVSLLFSFSFTLVFAVCWSVSNPQFSVPQVVYFVCWNCRSLFLFFFLSSRPGYLFSLVILCRHLSASSLTHYLATEKTQTNNIRSTHISHSKTSS